MPTGTIYPFLDRAMGGRLERNLRQWYGSGESYLTIGERLRSEYAISISDETVRRWLRELGIHKSERGAA